MSIDALKFNPAIKVQASALQRPIFSGARQAVEAPSIPRYQQPDVVDHTCGLAGGAVLGKNLLITA